jgi:hypothetical protein
MSELRTPNPRQSSQNPAVQIWKMSQMVEHGLLVKFVSCCVDDNGGIDEIVDKYRSSAQIQLHVPVYPSADPT